jgi:hypothetical protein
MIDLYGLFERASSWLEYHPSVIAWMVGWVAAMAAAQAIKQLLPAATDPRTMRTVVQTVAIVVGALVAHRLWPAESAHGLVYALVVGMSAPQAYSGIKAVVCWRLPGLAYRLSWDRVVDRKTDGGQP